MAGLEHQHRRTHRSRRTTKACVVQLLELEQLAIVDEHLADVDVVRR
jgi:hypothetical protein